MLFQQEHIDRYEQTDGAEGHEWLPSVYTLIVTTTGRTSGQPRKFALIYRQVGQNYVVVASRGGADTHPNWYLNLLAHPEVGVQVGADRIAVRARTAEGVERQQLWNAMLEVFPTYAEYQANTARVLPVVVLEPTG